MSKLTEIVANIIVATNSNTSGTTIHNAASKTTPVDADELVILDSDSEFGLKKLTWANLKAVVLPRGVITMWSGSIASIPAGWALCDGANGTPDLRNRFIVGASIDNVGVSNTTITGSNTKTGGSTDSIVVSHSHTADHSHTGSTSSTGAHTHTYTQPNAPLTNCAYSSSVSTVNSTTTGTTSSSGAHSHTVTINSASVTTSSTGSSGINANLPPYYALAYIMKL